MARLVEGVVHRSMSEKSDPKLRAQDESQTIFYLIYMQYPIFTVQKAFTLKFLLRSETLMVNYNAKVGNLTREKESHCVL